MFTYMDSATCARCLDIIAIPDVIVCSVYRTGTLAASNHFPVEAVVTISCNHEQLILVLKWSYSKADFGNLGKKVIDIKLDPQPDYLPDDLLTAWHNSLTAVLDQCVPMTALPRRKKKSTWMNSDIGSLI